MASDIAPIARKCAFQASLFGRRLFFIDIGAVRPIYVQLCIDKAPHPCIAIEHRGAKSPHTFYMKRGLRWWWGWNWGPGL
ncbi:protein of unknown function [Hyphomicrobium sp. MC1]|nr:protein of unknown function [Hyphomicrobium sp. MC1]